MSIYNPLIQPDASAVNIYYHGRSQYVDHLAGSVRVRVSLATVSDAVESLSQVVKVSTSENDVHSVERLSLQVKAKLRLLVWQRTRSGFILVGDPPRRG